MYRAKRGRGVTQRGGGLEDNSRVVLQGLIVRAVGMVSGGCCVCVGAGRSRQMLQMKEVVLCVHTGSGKNIVPRGRLIGV